MLTYDEQKKMERLMADDEDVRHLITTIKNDYQLTLSQISHEIRNPLTYMNSSDHCARRAHRHRQAQRGVAGICQPLGVGGLL